MNATAANLIERVLPSQAGLRQWVLTFPFAWRRRLAQYGALFGRLTRIFAETVQAFYARRAAQRGAKTGAVSAAQQTSSDLRLNPHLHMVALDGAYHEEEGELVWEGPGQLKKSEVGEVVERSVVRIERYLRRRGLLRTFDEDDEAGTKADPEGHLAASAVSGQAPPAWPQWVSRLAPLEPQLSPAHEAARDSRRAEPHRARPGRSRASRPRCRLAHRAAVPPIGRAVSSAGGCSVRRRVAGTKRGGDEAA